MGVSIYNPTAGSTIVFDGSTALYDAVAPIAFTDLDASGTIGAREALLLLRFENDSGDATALGFSSRLNGDTETIIDGVSCTSSGTTVADGSSTYLITTTESSGIFEWKANAAKTVRIVLMMYIY